MQDLPTAATLIEVAADHFRASGEEQSDSFRHRVAVNALDLAARELTLASSSAMAEHSRLRRLLGRDDTLFALNAQLCDEIRTRDFTGMDDLVDHLWRTTIEKLQVDQPRYSTLRLAGTLAPDDADEGNTVL